MARGGDARSPVPRAGGEAGGFGREKKQKSVVEINLIVLILVDLSFLHFILVFYIGDREN